MLYLILHLFEREDRILLHERLKNERIFPLVCREFLCERIWNRDFLAMPLDLLLRNLINFGFMEGHNILCPYEDFDWNQTKIDFF